MSSQPSLSSLSLFLPCYNEAENLPNMVEKCSRLLPNIANRYELIIINDGSSDNTVRVVKNLQLKYPHVKLINHPKNLGYGMALRTGYRQPSMIGFFSPTVIVNLI
jgi:glycosyltransferase involved in cell wall biosynthesis